MRRRTPSRALEGKKTYDTWQQGLLADLRGRAGKQAIHHERLPLGAAVSRWRRYLYKLTYELLIGVVQEKAAGMSVREEDKDFIATVYKYAFVGPDARLDQERHEG